MKVKLGILLVLITLPFFVFCQQTQEEKEQDNTYSPDKNAKIIFLHHSTGNCIWQGGVPEWFRKYNAQNGTNYNIIQRAFPQKSPYGWNNYPYDYWNIWVKNAGDRPFMGEPTLEILTKEYDVIVFKHCFPVFNIMKDTGNPAVNSPDKRIENYKLQYEALKKKLRQFPNNKFILWTGAVLLQNPRNSESAKLARIFFDWVRKTWDEPGDNIFLWDFYELETAGGYYLKSEYATGPADSHPNGMFSRMTAPLLGQRIVNVIEGKGDSSSITGK